MLAFTHSAHSAPGGISGPGAVCVQVRTCPPKAKAEGDEAEPNLSGCITVQSPGRIQCLSRCAGSCKKVSARAGPPTIHGKKGQTVYKNIVDK